MSEKNTYLKFIEITPDHMESQIANEINCTDDEKGRERIKELEEYARKIGNVSMVITMEKPKSFVHTEKNNH